MVGARKGSATSATVLLTESGAFWDVTGVGSVPSPFTGAVVSKEGDGVFRGEILVAISGVAA